MTEPKQNYTVYCDESRHTKAPTNLYMTIGGLWVPTSQKKALTAELRELLKTVGLGSEIKWSKTSRLKLDAYKAVIDFFHTKPINFRAIVIDQQKLDYACHKEDDDELGFYTFYYEMLIKWLQQPVTYNILLDFKKNRGYGHTDTLKKCLNHKVPLGGHISGVHCINSAETPLAQLADLLVGATAASWCGLRADSPKAELAAHIAQGVGMNSLRVSSLSPAFRKINIFKIALQ